MPRERGAAWVVLGCIVLLIVLAGGAVGGLAWWLWTEQAPPAATPAPTPKPPSSQSPTAAPDGRAAPVTSADLDLPPDVEERLRRHGIGQVEREIEAKLVVDDLSSVDPQAVYPQARRLAQLLAAEARLQCWSPMTLYGDLVEGAADLSKKGNFITYRFQADGVDSTKPPGKDQVKRDIDVRAEAGRLEGSLKISTGKRFPECKPLREPKCLVVRAWETAVHSGVPSNAVAQLHLTERWPPGSSDRRDWSFRVEGYDEYRREIDAETCALVKSWAARKR